MTELRIEKVWNGYVVRRDALDAQVEVYKTLPELLTRLARIYGNYGGVDPVVTISDEPPSWPQTAGRTP